MYHADAEPWQNSYYYSDIIHTLARPTATFGTSIPRDGMIMNDITIQFECHFRKNCVVFGVISTRISVYHQQTFCDNWFEHVQRDDHDPSFYGFRIKGADHIYPGEYWWQSPAALIPIIARQNKFWSVWPYATIEIFDKARCGLSIL